MNRNDIYTLALSFIVIIIYFVFFFLTNFLLPQVAFVVKKKKYRMLLNTNTSAHIYKKLSLNNWITN